MSDVPALFQRSRSHPLTPVLSSPDEACPTLEAGRNPLFLCSREHKASSNYLLEHSPPPLQFFSAVVVLLTSCAARRRNAQSTLAPTPPLLAKSCGIARWRH